ncbi:amino acid transporter AVT3C, partial [Cryptomeria japonica]|uniref:amino acid transporter AVT3C n=1 Tax=Cryptomeria japonica TaxID=3369 RepID=UPI0027DA43E3
IVIKSFRHCYSREAFIVFLCFIQRRINSEFIQNGRRYREISITSSGFELERNPIGDYLSLLSIVGRKARFIWALLPLELVMNGIRSLTQLAPFSIFADIVNVSAMLTVMGEDVMSIVRSVGPHVEAFTGLANIPYGVGVAVYAFEGVTMILPLELEMERKHRFGGILGLAFVFISCIYGGFGTLGYLAFGSETKDIVTFNLGKSLIVDFVQLALCLNLFITFPLMMNPVYEVVEGRFNRGAFSFFIRSVAVLFITLIALLVPSFTDFLSLIGSSIGSILGFILPALFHLHACSHESSSVQIFADIALIVFGIVFGVGGSISSMFQICKN